MSNLTITEDVFFVNEIKVSYRDPVKSSNRPKIADSEHSSQILKKWFELNNIDLEYKEYFIMMLLDRSLRVKGIHKISEGGICGTIADPTVIWGTATKSCAKNVIFCHNHPSGNINPSQQDLQLTKRLAKSGDLLDIKVVDHIILTHDNGYYSFSDNGLI